jgi:hypothetical protein
VSGLIDGVSALWVQHSRRDGTLEIQGYRSLSEAALQLAYRGLCASTPQSAALDNIDQFARELRAFVAADNAPPEGDGELLAGLEEDLGLATTIEGPNQVRIDVGSAHAILSPHQVRRLAADFATLATAAEGGQR